MKVLYIGDLCPNGTCRQRMDALSRLGLDAHPVDVRPALIAGGRIARSLRLRSQIGMAITRLNQHILEQAARLRPDLIWLDKPVFIRPGTLETLRRGGARLVHYTCDNPFTPTGPMGQWRLLRRSFAHVDLHLVPRQSGLEDYRQAGAGLVAMMPFAFDPFTHYPQPEARQEHPLVFIGSPHDRRPHFLTRMADAGLPISVAGPRWPRLPKVMIRGDGFWGAEYRAEICRSLLCMAFITHANRDSCAHKSFEITACGTALLAERSPHHQALFREDEDAAFFDCVEEAVEKARWYLSHDEARRTMARKGCQRIWSSGNSNEERMAAALAHLDPALGRQLTDIARRIITDRRHELGL